MFVEEDDSVGKRKRRVAEPIKPPTKKVKLTPSTPPPPAKPTTLKYIHE